jgi:hypothetical protein
VRVFLVSKEFVILIVKTKSSNISYNLCQNERKNESTIERWLFTYILSLFFLNVLCLIIFVVYTLFTEGREKNRERERISYDTHSWHEWYSNINNKVHTNKAFQFFSSCLCQ